MQFMDMTTLRRGSDIVVAERMLNSDGSQLLRPVAMLNCEVLERVAMESVLVLANPFVKKGPVKVLEPTYTGNSVWGGRMRSDETGGKFFIRGLSFRTACGRHRCWKRHRNTQYK